MLVRAWGATLRGLTGARVSVEVDAGSGLPAFQIVGQGDRVVAESRDRIRAAFRQSGLEFPPGRVTVNLAPTGLPKAGSALDLAVAVAVAATRLELHEGAIDSTLFLGELGLDGALHPVRGTLALLAAGAGLERAVVPVGGLAEASLTPAPQVFGARSLAEVLCFLKEEATLEIRRDGTQIDAPEAPDLRDVRGQQSAKRALEVAAAGGHNLLFIGPPGSGKTLLARRLPGLLPALDLDEALEVTRIHSVAGTLRNPGLLRRPPFRAPHHSTSDAGMAGGGRPLRPGEISLAHHGVLFLDELAEFRRPVLECLRQPLEEGEIRLVRAHGVEVLPARFQLVAATNPCPCGYRGDAQRDCACGDPLVARYRARLSGPLLDRIDLHVPVAPVPWQQMTGPGAGNEDSAAVRERVLLAREIQSARRPGAPRRNADLSGTEVTRDCGLDARSLALLERSVKALRLSMRAYVRILRVARTLADLDGAERPGVEHVGEAVGYRQLDRGGASSPGSP